ncbi:hypothetical protein ACIPX0_03495 [Streptomyces sp. NPDC090075]|uniref:hypothetical protein n=1 Tax=Streptomyces sp. NPDC090075 TaxID=3365937 RepID=UPI0038231EAB
MTDRDALAGACAGLVRAKALLDDWLAEGRAQHEERSLAAGGYSAWRSWCERLSPGDDVLGNFHQSPWREGLPEPRWFLKSALPGADFGSARFESADVPPDRTQRTEVDSSLVVGCLWRQPYERDLLDEPAAVLARINSEGGAQYAKAGDLPLYAAVEGKNRVSLAQGLRQPLIAETAQGRFPAARDLLLHQIDGTSLVAVSHRGDDALHVLPLPEEASAVLTAYGVDWRRRRHWRLRKYREALDEARRDLHEKTLSM